MSEYINQLSFVASRLYEMTNKNLSQLEGKCDEPNETQTYYLGLLRRQAIITYDLSVMLQDRPRENLTTPYILFRALLDDFLHVLYLELSENRDEDIVKINASGHCENFKSLENLTLSKNKEYHDVQFDYLSVDEFESLKVRYKGQEKNIKYFQDIEGFKFKHFYSLTSMAKSINSSSNYNVARDRAFYLWKSFSSFVHYSNWCYDFEMTENVVKIQHMEEAFQYVFNTIYFSACFFKKDLNIKCYIDRFMLEEMKFVLVQHLE